MKRRRAAGHPLRSALARALALGLAWGVGVRAPSARAQAPALTSTPLVAASVRLDYRREPGAEQCVSGEQLMAAVETRLGRRVFAPASADLAARVSARRVSGRFVIAIALSDRQGRDLGTRELTTRASHCSALDEALALVLSLAADMPRIEPARAATDPSPTRASLATEVRAVALGTPISIPENTHAPRRGLRFETTAGAALLTGILPSPAPGLELGLGATANAFWPVVLRGSVWAGQQRTLAAAKGASFSAQTLELGVCPWAERLGGFEVSVWALQRLGRFRARGFGFDEPARDEGWLLHFGAEAALTRRFGPLFVSASGAGLVPAIRRRYFFTDAADVTLHEQPWLSLSAALRVGLEI